MLIFWKSSTGKVHISIAGKVQRTFCNIKCEKLTWLFYDFKQDGKPCKRCLRQIRYYYELYHVKTGFFQPTEADTDYGIRLAGEIDGEVGLLRVVEGGQDEH